MKKTNKINNKNNKNDKNNKVNKAQKLLKPIIVLVIIIVLVLIIVIKNKSSIKINTEDPNGDLITIIDENNIDYSKFIDMDDKDDETQNIKYELMTTDSYYSNSRKNKTFRIQDVIHNKNKTITIKGRVYEYIDLPEKLSAEEYNALLDGKALNILGEKVTKLDNDEIAQEAGYELALKIENKRIKNECLYYVTKNEDGTANLYNGSESSIAEGTDKYLEITLNNNFICYILDEKIELKDYYKKDIHIANKNKTRLLHENAEFVFEEERNSYLIKIVFNTI